MTPTRRGMYGIKGLNKGQYCSVPTELNRWVYANGERSPGLVARRQEEGDLFNSAIQKWDF